MDESELLAQALFDQREAREQKERERVAALEADVVTLALERDEARALVRQVAEVIDSPRSYRAVQDALRRWGMT